MSKTLIYADHAATTALSPMAREAMEPFLQVDYGNPSTLYSLAREPRKAVAHSREMIAAAIHADPSEIFSPPAAQNRITGRLKERLFSMR